MGSLMEEDIPWLYEGWKKSCKDIMNVAPERLPPLWEVNHQIPTINKSKRYKYHASRCPDSLKNELSKKIKCYTYAEWWEPTQAEQAAPMLCTCLFSLSLHSCHLPHSTPLHTHTHHSSITLITNTPFQHSPTITLIPIHFLSNFQHSFSNNHHDICQRPRNPKAWPKQLQSMEWRNAGMA